MRLSDLHSVVNDFYQSSAESKPLVLTVINPDGSVTAYEVDSAGLLDTGHPSGNGDRVANLIIYPVR